MKNLKHVLLAGICCFTTISLNAQVKISKATPAEIANDNKELKVNIDDFKKSPSGLLYIFTDYDGKQNNRAKPAKYSKVRIQYALMTIDRKKMIKDWGGMKPPTSEVAVDKLPYGMQEVIKMMDIGTKCLFKLPAKLGNNKYGPIGNGRALTGTIELVDAF